MRDMRCGGRGRTHVLALLGDPLGGGHRGRGDPPPLEVVEIPHPTADNHHLAEAVMDDFCVMFFFVRTARGGFALPRG